MEIRAGKFICLKLLACLCINVVLILLDWRAGGWLRFRGEETEYSASRVAAAGVQLPSDRCEPLSVAAPRDYSSASRYISRGMADDSAREICESGGGCACLSAASEWQRFLLSYDGEAALSASVARGRTRYARAACSGGLWDARACDTCGAAASAARCEAREKSRKNEDADRYPKAGDLFGFSTGVLSINN